MEYGGDEAVGVITFGRIHRSHSLSGWRELRNAPAWNSFITQVAVEIVWPMMDGGRFAFTPGLLASSLRDTRIGTMAFACILVDNRSRRPTLEDLRNHLARANIPCRMGEWRFLDQTVPQLEFQTEPPFALQLNDDSETVTAETLEMIEDRCPPFSAEQLSALQCSDARIEVVSGAQPEIDNLPGGGILSFTPEAELNSAETQRLLRAVASYINGTLVFDE